MNQIVSELTKDQLKTDVPDFKVGDGVKVRTLVREGDKRRVQIFAGVVIARKGSISSTYSKSSAIHFFSHAKEIQGLKIRRPVQRIEGLPDLEEVKAMHHKLYARVWESWQVRYNNSRSNEKRSNHG